MRSSAPPKPPPLKRKKPVSERGWNLLGLCITGWLIQGVVTVLDKVLHH